MSLNEDYLDDLLKSVTTEDESSSDAAENKEKAIDKLSSMVLSEDNVKESDQNVNLGVDERPTILDEKAQEDNDLLDDDLDALLGDIMSSVKEENQDIDEAQDINIEDFPDTEPVVEESATEEPMVDESAIEESAIEEPMADESAIGESAIAEPMADDFAIEEPAIEEPIADESVVEESEAEEPMADESAIEESAIEEPIVEDSMLDESISGDLMGIEPEENIREDSINEEPVVEESVVEEPTTDVSDIEELLKSIEDEEHSVEEPNTETDDQDILSMLDSMGDDSDLAEIGDLLNKDENHEAISTDESDTEESSDVADILSAMDDSSDNIQDSEEDIQPKKKKKLFAKKDKKPNESDGEKGEKKKGFFAKLLDIFFEEDDLDTEEPGVGEEGATEENQAILDELDGRKKPKPKKEKKKKEKKPKKQKPPKPKKAPKPKKEKKPKKVKEPDPNEKPEKKIPAKKIIMVAIFAVSVFIGIYLLTSMVPETMTIQAAQNAYNEGDYRTTYTTLAGMELSEGSEELFKKTTVIVELQGKYEGFLNYQKMDMGVEALNALLKGIEKYDKLYSYGEQYGVTAELDKTYQQILSALSDTYGLSEEDSRQILTYDRITYTKKLDSIINGTEFIDPNAPVEEEETLQDMLPEEEALLNMTVIDGEKADEQAASEESTEDMLPEEENMSSEKDNQMNKAEVGEEESKNLYEGEIQGDNLSVDFSTE